ncbi:uridine 5'-monophosphate synthase-like [Euwallacea similis]|uniref:uridine 5'-monophosphate synthase-like n=1 Tax=Euwallacea similis TaxID=1736056 RepID=UPI00344DEAF1
MCDASLSLKDISVRLFKANAIKFGNFTTGSGALTPVYFDLRVIVSYPSLMNDVSILLGQLIQEIVKENECKTHLSSPGRNLICGVPITAIPITSLASVHIKIPMILKRKVAKSYGTRELIEGVWNKGDTCVLVDDVIMFGDSILDTVKDLVDAGIKCSQAVVICDREQGAVEKLARKGIQVYSLLTLTQILEYLKEDNYVSQESCDMVRGYLAANPVSDELTDQCNNGL